MVGTVPENVLFDKSRYESDLNTENVDGNVPLSAFERTSRRLWGQWEAVGRKQEVLHKPVRS